MTKTTPTALNESSAFYAVFGVTQPKILRSLLEWKKKHAISFIHLDFAICMNPFQHDQSIWTYARLWDDLIDATCDVHQTASNDTFRVENWRPKKTIDSMMNLAMNRWLVGFQTKNGRYYLWIHYLAFMAFVEYFFLCFSCNFYPTDVPILTFAVIIVDAQYLLYIVVIYVAINFTWLVKKSLSLFRVDARLYAIAIKIGTTKTKVWQ